MYGTTEREGFLKMSIIGDRLKQLRLEKKLTLRELGRLMNNSHSFISDIESGRSDPSVQTLNALADVLGTTTDYLLGRTDNPCQYQPGDHNMVARESYPTTIAAHRTDNILDRDDVSEEAKKSVEEFIEFVKKKHGIRD